MVEGEVISGGIDGNRWLKGGGSKNVGRLYIGVRAFSYNCFCLLEIENWATPIEPIFSVPYITGSELNCFHFFLFLSQIHKMASI